MTNYKPTEYWVGDEFPRPAYSREKLIDGKKKENPLEKEIKEKVPKRIMHSLDDWGCLQ